MQVEFKIDPSCKQPKVVIYAEKISPEVETLLRRLSEDMTQMIAGFREDHVVLLDQNSIIRIYSASSKVFAVTGDGEYTLRLRLYELENRLDATSFVRISHSEIINLRKVKNFDLSFSGTICVHFLDKSTTFVSRRYVSRIKQVLGI